MFRSTLIYFTRLRATAYSLLATFGCWYRTQVSIFIVWFENKHSSFCIDAFARTDWLDLLWLECQWTSINRQVACLFDPFVGSWPSEILNEISASEMLKWRMMWKWLGIKFDRMRLLYSHCFDSKLIVKWICRAVAHLTFQIIIDLISLLFLPNIFFFFPNRVSSVLH